ncbi:LytR/AlgR family response regulator transcription factor [Sinomicrobium weinanense]|uniref:Response regulator transcription factor n=1 Tax=Sinomicrobium weinanense TaxID=2842200 RepID=A0A926JSE2_9FLAO|nr:LytTR family DNA-binding domain-containing protein [Sinomicrobium weinanense]MBC9796398.1 response regulator transcription factor [Sinomicrobium weinanense]MBU3122601.1 LytTR family DNA-binding domain-containing protein [Sinomicrobium weinanense]
MIRCIAVDDEKPALDLLEDNIRQVAYLELVKRCKNAMEAIEVLQSEKIDLIFLDVQMPGLSGLQFVQTLMAPPMIVLVTAYEKYALEGFNLDVVDYLVKPVALERFIRACNKAKALFDLRQSKTPQADSSIRDHFFVHVEYGLVKIVVDDILYVEGLKDYIKIHLSSASRPVVTRMSLKAMMEQLPDDRFIRTHKSYIVSIPRVTSIKRDLLYIGDIEIPVSESYKESMARILGRSKN